METDKSENSTTVPTFSDVKVSTRIGPVNVNKYKCEICPLKYATKIQCKSHQARHRKKKECEICGQITSSYQLLAEHLTKHFPDEIKHHCRVAGCRKGFFYKSTSKKHSMVHFGYKCIQPTCPRRDKRFSTRCSLEDHVKKHLGLLKYDCNVCKNKCFASKRGLNQHKKSKAHIKWANYLLRKNHSKSIG